MKARDILWGAEVVKAALTGGDEEDAELGWKFIAAFMFSSIPDK